MNDASARKGGGTWGNQGFPREGERQRAQCEPEYKRAGYCRPFVSNAVKSAIRMRMGEVGECGIGRSGWSVIPRSRVPEMLVA